MKMKWFNRKCRYAAPSKKHLQAEALRKKVKEQKEHGNGGRYIFAYMLEFYS